MCVESRRVASRFAAGCVCCICVQVLQFSFYFYFCFYSCFCTYFSFRFRLWPQLICPRIIEAAAAALELKTEAAKFMARLRLFICIIVVKVMFIKCVSCADYSGSGGRRGIPCLVLQAAYC